MVGAETFKLFSSSNGLRGLGAGCTCAGAFLKHFSLMFSIAGIFSFLSPPRSTTGVLAYRANTGRIATSERACEETAVSGFQAGQARQGAMSTTKKLSEFWIDLAGLMRAVCSVMHR